MPPEGFPAARASRGEAFTHELYWAGEETEQRAYSVSGRAIRSLDGTNTGAVVTFAEVTALINALAAKDNFVATVSHELRTPLTSILGYLELVLDEPGHEDIAPELRIVERNAGNLLGLVNDLIAVASENVELVLRDTDIADLLAAAVAANQARAALCGVALVLDAEEPLTARVDPARIRQVVGNLISNAVKYSPDGGEDHRPCPQERQGTGLLDHRHGHRHDGGGPGTGIHQVFPFGPVPRYGHSGSRPWPSHQQNHHRRARRVDRPHQRTGRGHHRDLHPSR